MKALTQHSSPAFDLAAAFATTPYLEGGRTIHGADCWGLVEVWYRVLLSEELNERGDDHSSLGFFKQYKRLRGRFEKADTPQNHDIVVMYDDHNNRRFEGHCGIYFDEQVVQMERDIGCNTLPFHSPETQHRLAGLYRLPDMKK